MGFYLFFKKYFIFMGKGLAELMYKKGITANQASIIAFFIIISMFCIINMISNDSIYVFILFIGIILKLVLNAIDGIIARKSGDKSKIGMYLNVGTDIIPDIFIIYLILTRYNIENEIINFLIGIMLLYLILEFIFIHLYNKQNLFYGKDLRTIFYIFLLIVLYFKLNINYLIIYYFLILIIHNVGFFLPKYRN